MDYISITDEQVEKLTSMTPEEQANIAKKMTDNHAPGKEISHSELDEYIRQIEVERAYHRAMSII